MFCLCSCRRWKGYKHVEQQCARGSNQKREQKAASENGIINGEAYEMKHQRATRSSGLMGSKRISVLRGRIGNDHDAMGSSNCVNGTLAIDELNCGGPNNNFNKKTKVILKEDCNNNPFYHPSGYVNTTDCLYSNSEEKAQKGAGKISHSRSSTKKRGVTDDDFTSSSVVETKQSQHSHKEMKKVKYFGFKKAKKGVMYDIVCIESKRHRQNLREEAAADELNCNATFIARLIALKEANNGELGFSSNVLKPRLALKDRIGHGKLLPADYSPMKRNALAVDALEREDVGDALRVAISQKTGFIDLPDSELVKRMKVVRKEWCTKLDVGDAVEKCYGNGKWYQAKIIERNGSQVKLHFVGWAKKYDEWADISAPYRYFVPMHTFTRPRLYNKVWRPKPHKEEEWVLEDCNGRVLGRVEANDLLIAATATNPIEGALPKNQMGPSLRSGGICCSPQQSCTDKVTSLLNSESGDDEDSRTTTEDTQASSTLPDDGDTTMCLTEEDANDWHCSICMKISAPGGSLVGKTELVCCDGPCLRSFHMGCLELDDGHEFFLNQVWLCDLCTDRSGPCFLCNVKDEEVKPCEARQCGRFYHPNCLLEWRNNNACRNSQASVTSTVQKYNSDTVGLICGRHSCMGCGEKGERQDLLRCLLCPLAYHPNCTPASIPKVLEARLFMCPAHPGSSLPELNEESDDKKTPSSWYEDLTLAASVPPLNAPRHDIRHFRLPMSFLEEYRSHTVGYKSTSSLLFRGSTHPNRIMPDGSCVCVPKKGGGGCDESCLNRLLHVECYGLGKKGMAQRASTSMSYTHANCSIGPKCSNRRMQQPKSSLPRTEVFAEFERGLGVRTIDFIPKDAFIFEYVGEVIEEAEMERRLEAQHYLRPNDSDHYIMELKSGLYVDAKHYGNTSRFINHSCNPNCVVERWNIGPSDQRIGIFSKKNIQPGEALSYDYSFCTSDASAFICRCGDLNCRGTLAAKKRVKDKIDPQTLSAPERKEYFKREKKKKEGQMRRDKQRLWMTGRFLPGDGMEEVKDGPTCKLFGLCRLKRVFLPCNAIKGMDMIPRKQRLENRI